MFTGSAGIILDRNSDVPLHRQLVAAFRGAILSGRLRAGERVLSSRELQAHLGVSRTTALNALSQLQAEGYLVTVQGSGTFVTDALADHVAKPRADVPEVDVIPTEAATQFLSARNVIEPAAALAIRLQGATAFRPGIPALDHFPVAQFKRTFSTLDWTQGLLDYPRSWTSDRLRNAIVHRLAQTRGIVCSPDQVLIVPSTKYAMSLVGRVLLNPHDSVIMEDPGYPSIRSALLALGARILPAPVDDDGIDVASFARQRAAFAYVTPSHQYPTGAVLSLERRFALLNWASACNAWIVEDDYDSEFSSTGQAPPALQGIDEAHRVLYIGTFSKVLAPSIRVSYLIAPRALCKALKAAHHATGGYPSPILQAALAVFLEDGHYARHVARMRRVYNERRRFLSSALTSSGLVQVRDRGAGLHFVVELPKTTPDVQVSERAAAHGVVAPSLSEYFHGRPTLNGLVIGFAATPVPAVKAAISMLLKAL